MRKLSGAVFQSLDGVMQAPGAPNEDSTGGFRFGGWIAPHSDDTLGEGMVSLLAAPFDLLLGRRTYEIFAAYWPYAPEGDFIGTAFDRAAKYVVTHGNDRLDWVNSHRVGGIDAVADLKRSEGPDLLIQGSSTLYPPLFAAGLIDTLFVMTFPIVLGGGKRLFGAGTPPFALKLVDSRTSKAGVLIATYQPAGDVPTGDLTTHPPSDREIARQKRMRREA